jgi:hypothetical protein
MFPDKAEIARLFEWQAVYRGGFELKNNLICQAYAKKLYTTLHLATGLLPDFGQHTTAPTAHQ